MPLFLQARRKKRWQSMLEGQGGLEEEDSIFGAYMDGDQARRDMQARIRGVDPTYDLALDSFDEYKRGSATEAPPPLVSPICQGMGSAR